MVGGAGKDRFIYFEDAGNDLIYHFEVENDVIDLRLLPEAIAFSDLTIRRHGERKGRQDQP